MPWITFMLVWILYTRGNNSYSHSFRKVTWLCKRRPGGWVGFPKSVAPAPLPGILLTWHLQCFQGFFRLLSSLAVANRPWSHICTTLTLLDSPGKSIWCVCTRLRHSPETTLPGLQEVNSVAEVGKALRRREGPGGRVCFPWVSRRSQRLSEREGRPTTNPEMCMGFL